MDSIKLEQLITENMKSIFGFALTRLGNANEAEELASDILYEIIRSAQNLKDEERFYSFMWKIAENTYMDYLRRKSKNASRAAELDENIADESESALDKIIQKEELNLFGANCPCCQSNIVTLPFCTILKISPAPKYRTDYKSARKW